MRSGNDQRLNLEMSEAEHNEGQMRTKWRRSNDNGKRLESWRSERWFNVSEDFINSSKCFERFLFLCWSFEEGWKHVSTPYPTIICWKSYLIGNFCLTQHSPYATRGNFSFFSSELKGWIRMFSELPMLKVIPNINSDFYYVSLFVPSLPSK